MARPLAWASEEHIPLLLNCFSGIGAAVALANLAVIGTLLTGRRWVGLLTGSHARCHAWDVVACHHC